MEIILVRHGKPTAANNPKVSAIDFFRWLKTYQYSTVNLTHTPPRQLFSDCQNSFIISSELVRAIHSAEIVCQQLPNRQYDLLNEMPMPVHKLPGKFRVNQWLMINRILWWLGYSGKVESFKQAKLRASLMARELVKLSVEQQRITVFGHGLMNRQISIELTKLGWLRESQGNGYWGRTKLTYL